jgi:hypothetical protein
MYKVVAHTPRGTFSVKLDWEDQEIQTLSDVLHEENIDYIRLEDISGREFIIQDGVFNDSVFEIINLKNDEPSG